MLGVGDDPEFARLVAEGEAVPVAGWDFSWFEGRATEERPSWGYARMMAERMGRARAALDIQTGGGEVLAGIPASAARPGRHRVVAAEPEDSPGESHAPGRDGDRGCG